MNEIIEPVDLNDYGNPDCGDNGLVDIAGIS